MEIFLFNAGDFMTITSAQVPNKAPITKQDEKILVISRTILLSEDQDFTGFKPVSNLNTLESLITKHQLFMWRSEVENNTNYKQIIPYLVFKHQDTYFLMRRTSHASEQRLKDKYSLGIGGHIRQEDLVGKSMGDWANREFHEEVSYRSALTIKPLGIINDDRDPVGQVHFGLVYLLEGDSSGISVRSELKEGMLYTLQECLLFYDRMESWSQFVYDFLKGYHANAI